MIALRVFARPGGVAMGHLGLLRAPLRAGLGRPGTPRAAQETYAPTLCTAACRPSHQPDGMSGQWRPSLSTSPATKATTAPAAGEGDTWIP